MRNQASSLSAQRSQPLASRAQVLARSQAVLDRPVAERRFGQPLRPRPAPPGPVRVPGVAPRAARGLDRGEAGLPGPGQQVPTRVRLPADGPGHGPVQRQPLGHLRLPGKPEEPAVVPVPCRDDPAGPAHPAHLPQRRHRVGQVLEHLVRVHHVERPVREVQAVHVPGVERNVALPAPLRLLPGLRQHVPGRVDAGHVPAGYQGRQVHGDRARAAAHVEHARVRRQPRQQVPRRVLRGAPAV